MTDHKYLLSHLIKRLSPINGFGLFSDTHIFAGEILCIAGNLNNKDNVVTYPVPLINHSKKNNVSFYKDADYPHYYFLIAKRHIFPKDEILLNYNNVPEFFLSQADINMLASLKKKP